MAASNRSVSAGWSGTSQEKSCCPMRKTTTAVLAAVAAVPLAFLAAAPASAAPGDITVQFTTTPNPGGGNSVTGTFTATGDNLPNYCEMGDFLAFDPATNETLFGVSAVESPANSTVIATDAIVPDGTYSINWYCDLEDGSYDATMAYFGGTREPTTLVVPAVIPEEPEVPEPVCTGSACLPTGSFGF